MPSSQLQEIVEYRGVEGLVAAEVLTDNNDPNEGYTTGDVFAIAGVAEVSRSTETSDEAHYYDNMPAIVISSTGKDELTINTSAIPLDVLAKITGQVYDAETAAMIEGPRKSKYFAVGYRTKKTNGDEVLVWRYKGMFNIPDTDNITENDGTDANGQELIYTGISTTHKFAKNENKGAKALNVDCGKDLADVSTFFDSVTTPDDLQPKQPVVTTYTLHITQGAETTVTVMRDDEALADGATLNPGDELVISCVGGTLTVNGITFESGATQVVGSDITVVSTASA